MLSFLCKAIGIIFNNLVKIRGARPRPKQNISYRLPDETNLTYFQNPLLSGTKKEVSFKLILERKSFSFTIYISTMQTFHSEMLVRYKIIGFPVLLFSQNHIVQEFPWGIVYLPDGALFQQFLNSVFFYLCFCFCHAYWSWSFDIVWNLKKKKFVPFYNLKNFFIFG